MDIAYYDMLLVTWYLVYAICYIYMLYCNNLLMAQSQKARKALPKPELEMDESFLGMVQEYPRARRPATMPM